MTKHSSGAERSSERFTRSGDMGSLAAVPLWLLGLLALLGAASVYVLTDAGARGIVAALGAGLAVTIRVTLIGFAFALVIGVAAGLARSSGHRLIREGATLYIELVRGVPLLVLILWIGYGLTPWLLHTLRETVQAWAAGGWSMLGLIPLAADRLEICRRPSQCVSEEVRGIFGLAIGYGAYLAEVVRSGLLSVGAGQREAAAALGLTGWQTTRLIVLPQALRVALPPLGNDFIAMLKDSSLISVLAVRDIVQQARFEISRTFQAFEVWNLVAILYLSLTLALSLGVRYLERRVAVDD